MTIYSLVMLLSEFWTSQSVVPCKVLTIAPWPACRFLRRQVIWSDIPISLRIFHSLCDPHKDFHIVNETEVDVFLKFPCFLCDPMNVGNLISGSSAFFKPSLYIWKFLVHLLLRPSLNYFEYYLGSMWNESNCTVVCAFFGIALLWGWDENWPFLVVWPLLSFPYLLAYWVQHFKSIIL